VGLHFSPGRCHAGRSSTSAAESGRLPRPRESTLDARVRDPARPSRSKEMISINASTKRCKLGCVLGHLIELALLHAGMPRSTYASLNTQPGLGPPSGLGKAEPRRVAEDIPSGAGATQRAALPALPAPLAPPCPPPSPAHLPVPCAVSWFAAAGTYLSNQPVSFTLEGVVGFNPLVAEEIRGSGRPLPAARRPRRPRPPRPECAAGRNGRLRRQLRAVDRVYVSGEGGVRGEPPAHLSSPPNRAPRLARPRPTPPRCARRDPFGGGGQDDALRGRATRRGRAVWRPATALQAGHVRLVRAACPISTG